MILHKSIRHTQIERNGQRYNLEIIARSDAYRKVTTSFWICIDGYVVKYKITDMFKLLEDKELEEIIQQHIDGWIEDYELFIRRFI